MTETLFFLDTETFSPVPIRNGSYRYAEEAEVMVASWAEGIDGKADVVDLTEDPMPKIVLEAIRDPDVKIVGHNFGNFDRVVLRDAYGIDIRPERIHDTMVQALSHGLPGALGKLCGIFGLTGSDAKSEGKDLIQLFCKPRPKNSKLRRATKETHPKEWRDFLDYARQDIPPMQRLYRMLPDWNYHSRPEGNGWCDEYRYWLLDQKVNDRGFKVDRELATVAIALVKKEQAKMALRTQELTDDEVMKVSQRDKLLAHLLDYYGVSLPDLTKSTLEARINDEQLPWVVRELIAIRLESNQTSTSKYPALLNSVCKDDRLRGTIQFCGAARTGRDAGRIFQPQNIVRPKMKPDEIEFAIRLMKHDRAEQFYDNPISVASDAARGAIIASEGKKLVVADLANIEGRMLAWLAGEEWKLQAFRDYDNILGYTDTGKPIRKGHDLYLITAGGILGKPPEEVTDDERQSTGKVPELACGFQGAAGAFATMAALYGLDLPEATVRAIVDGWRAKNPAIVQFWYDMQDAAWQTTLTGRETTAGRIRFTKVGAWLKMHLPSGRVLAYADPKIVPDPKWKGRQTLSYMGLDSYTKQWKRLYTYGGKLAENATQAAARDVLKHGAELVEDAGYPILLPVHDELVTETKDTDKYSHRELARLLATRPWWADETLPLAAAGFEAYRYRKG